MEGAGWRQGCWESTCGEETWRGPGYCQGVGLRGRVKVGVTLRALRMAASLERRPLTCVCGLRPGGGGRRVGPWGAAPGGAGGGRGLAPGRRERAAERGTRQTRRTSHSGKEEGARGEDRIAA